MTISEVEDIVAAFGLPESPNLEYVPKDRVLLWMKAEDIEVLGALYSYILDKKYAARIRPALIFADYHPFVIRYYERCFRENPDGEWTDTRYGAGRDLVGWFSSLWKDSSIPRAVLDEIKNWLGELYKSADTDLRHCIINSTLEHLLEAPEIAKYFADWKLDPVLQQAYAEALLWSQEGEKGGEKKGEKGVRAL